MLNVRLIVLVSWFVVRPNEHQIGYNGHSLDMQEETGWIAFDGRSTVYRLVCGPIQQLLTVVVGHHVPELLGAWFRGGYGE